MIYSTSLHSHNNPLSSILSSSPFYKWKSWATKINLHTAVSGRLKIRTQKSWPKTPNLANFTLLLLCQASGNQDHWVSYDCLKLPATCWGTAKTLMEVPETSQGVRSPIKTSQGAVATSATNCVALLNFHNSHSWLHSSWILICLQPGLDPMGTFSPLP
jgi:hypothetical protein